MGFFSGIKQFVGQRLGMSQSARVDVAKRFELSATVEQGSMSKVYWARDRQLRRMVCVKLLDKDLTARFEARFKGLRRPTEGAICLGLKHKSIVETYEYGLTTTGQPYIVMEMIEGTRLDRMMAQKSRQLLGNRINCLLQVAEGLEYIHQQRFVHADICPRNIIITHQGAAKIIDFGISVPVSPESDKPNQAPSGNDMARDFHKPVTAYMDPELFHRAMTDRRNDLFGFGVTAYETLTGRLPWIKAQRLPAQARNPREFVKDLGENTARFLMKAIHPDVDHRFQSATEMKESLTELPAY